MSTFVKGGDARTPFGRNEFLRSTKILQTESYTLSAASIPVQTIDDFPNQKIVQPGFVIAKITSGAEAGKVGFYSTDAVGVTDGRADAANLVGLNLTFLPWQTIERDVEISVVYECVAVQGWCLELTAAQPVVGEALSNATADALRGAKGLQINFK